MSTQIIKISEKNKINNMDLWHTPVLRGSEKCESNVCKITLSEGG